MIQHVAYAAHASHEDGNLAIADMISLAFFFLLHPGEYTGTNSKTSLFGFCDVQLFVGGRRLQLEIAPDIEIQSAVGKQWFCRYKAALFLAHREAKLS